MVKGVKWLDSKQDKPEINISGTWESPEWGAAVFKQEREERLLERLAIIPRKALLAGIAYIY